MPLSYSFKDQDNKSVSLNDIDTAVCKYWDIEVDADKYCFPYQILTMAVVAVGMKYDVLTKETVDTWVEDDEKASGETDTKWSAFYKKFMYEDYTAEVWR